MTHTTLSIPPKNGTNEPATTMLDALCKAGISLCAETAEYLKIAEMSPKPTDVTLDFPLILDTVSKPEYAHLLEESALYASDRAASDESMNSKEAIADLAMSRLLALLADNVMRAIPGRVSLPLDPRLFVDKRMSDTTDTTSAGSQIAVLPTVANSETYLPEDLASALARARALLAENDTLNLVRTRVLVQIPATPLGMAVGHALTAAGAHAAMSLVASVPQALACAQACVSLVSLAADDSKLVRRIVSDMSGYGYTEKTEVMICGLSSPKDVMSVSCDETRAVGSGVGIVNMIALTPGILEALHDTPNPSFALALAPDEVNSGPFSSTPGGAPIASSLPEYFSGSAGRTTVEYAHALAKDNTTAELVSGLQKHSMCAQMVEELLAAELDRVAAIREVGGGSPSGSPAEENSVSQGDIISITNGLQDTFPSETGDGDALSASTTDFEDVDLHSPLTNIICASNNVDAPSSRITSTGDDFGPTVVAAPAMSSANVGSAEELSTVTSRDVSESESMTEPISDREKPRMSVKARVMEIEARLDKDKRIADDGMLNGDVSVYA